MAVVERYSVTERVWERCPSLKVSRGSHGVAAEGGRLYAVAGGGINSNLTSCEVYHVVWHRHRNPHSQLLKSLRCLILQPMHGRTWPR